MKSRNGKEFAFGVVILAAGQSQRMGQPKLLLPWGQTNVLGHLLRQWAERGARQVAVVCSGDGHELLNELDRVGFPMESRIINPTPERGMFNSIQWAASWPSWQEDLTHWVIVLGDQPHLQDQTLQTLLELAVEHPDRICQPMRNGHYKHPVLLPKPLFVRLRKSSVPDLRQFLTQYGSEMAGWEADDAGLDFDMNTPDDYERAKQFFFVNR